MTELQTQLKDIVLANPDKYNLDRLKVLLDEDWSNYKDGLPPFSKMIPLHEWILPFQVKFTDEEHELVEDYVAKMGLSISDETFAAPAIHTIGYRDTSNDTRGVISKKATGDILEKAKGNVMAYEFPFCATAGPHTFIMHGYVTQGWNLQRTMEYIAARIKSDKGE